MLWTSLLYLFLLDHSHALHHMKTRASAKLASAEERPLRIRNHCPVDIYPAIATQNGRGPSTGGYRAQPGNTTSFTVSADWQGRIWGRTNCSFNEQGTGPKVEGGWFGTGQACLTGDCGGVIDCKGTVSLARVDLSRYMLISYLGSTSNVSRIHHVIRYEPLLLRHLPCGWLQPSDRHCVITHRI